MLILASRSPTRQALLRQAGLAFAIAPALIDERAVEAGIVADGGTPADVALALAAAKAQEVSGRHTGDWIIGADQTLQFGEEILHKPGGRIAAAAQLARLAGHEHRLHSAVALVHDGEIVWSKLASVRLAMRATSEAERNHVLDIESEAAFDSVGGYRIEGPSIRLFEKIEGDYFAILGLPLVELLAALRHHAPDLLEARP